MVEPRPYARLILFNGEAIERPSGKGKDDKQNFGKLGLPILALAGVLMFVGVPRADAKEHHHHHHKYDSYYYPYGDGYNYPYYYGYGGGFIGGFGGEHHEHGEHGGFGGHGGYGHGSGGGGFQVVAVEAFMEEVEADFMEEVEAGDIGSSQSASAGAIMRFPFLRSYYPLQPLRQEETVVRSS